MKKIIIHSVSVVISFIWLIKTCQTLNPFTLKGAGFLKFYLLLLLGFYFSIFILKLLKETISKTTLYFMLLIFVWGVIKLIRGILLGKPVGFLVMILIVECVVMLLFMLFHVKNKIKN
ncbi:hypothetical protein EG359_14840 [Chryseobacterium joostei]|uniref:DUF4345 domain-containing protein n=1 Tax=Chryseobacterium joostei TaxID=112234 RepID=A0A1N7I7R1_9FLAO|nr:hypothetical protein EG359_14840 [Chryseobacterium joostei]SIS33099.1 hypothetical protein SAMN05421768_103158 [Chryseobacterium joostei]